MSLTGSGIDVESSNSALVNGLVNKIVPNANTNPDIAPDLYSSFLVAGDITAPPGVLQIGPFEFSYEGDDSVVLTNEITDHWVEDNTAVQDHIGVNPAKITLKGRVSELTLSARTLRTISGLIATVENGLSQVPAFLGKYTPGTTDRVLKAITQVQSIATQIQQAGARVAQIANFFFPSASRNKQQAAFAMLSALRNSRVLFTVYTPFQVFNMMAIESITATQPAGTKTISDFTVVMKQIQLTDDLSGSSFFSLYGGRAVAGYQPKTANGFLSGAASSALSVTSAISPHF